MTVQSPAVATASLSRSDEKAGQLRFIGACLLCLIFHSLQYAVRSAPGVMIPELISAFGLTGLGVSFMLAKQLSHMANADAAGIVLEARIPIILTSRADNVRTRLASGAVAVLLVHARRQASPAAMAVGTGS